MFSVLDVTRMLPGWLVGMFPSNATKTSISTYTTQVYTDFNNSINIGRKGCGLFSIDLNYFQFRLNISRAQIFSQSNYQPGLRQWVLYNPPVDTIGSIRCHIVIDEFQNFSDYLEVGSSIPIIPNLNQRQHIVFFFKLDNNRRQAAGDAYRE